MLRLSRYLLLALATLAAAPLGAQTAIDSLRAEIAGLRSENADLRRIVGTVEQGAIPCPALEANRPPELESGQYNFAFRAKQIGCEIDRIVTMVGSLGTHPNVQSYINAAVASVVVAPPSAPPPSSTISHYLAGDVRIDGRLCINADCVPGLDNQLQIFADQSTGIYFESNRDRSQFQLALPHWGEFGLQADGGMRMNNNIRWIRQSDGTYREQTDGVRPWSSHGPDSQGTWSGQQRRPDFAHDNTQDWWISIDEYTKTISLQSPRPGWKWALTTSSGLITLDKWYFPPCCN